MSAVWDGQFTKYVRIDDTGWTNAIEPCLRVRANFLNRYQAISVSLDTFIDLWFILTFWFFGAKRFFTAFEQGKNIFETNSFISKHTLLSSIFDFDTAARQQACNRQEYEKVGAENGPWIITGRIYFLSFRYTYAPVIP